MQLVQLPRFPAAVLSPTLLYAGQRVFSFGGYEVPAAGIAHKVASKKVFAYQVKKQV